MVVGDGAPGWYRGPADPSGYRVQVASDLRWMRTRKGNLTQDEIAKALARELRRAIPVSSVSRWESGVKLAGGDVYRAYIVITGAALPTDLGVDPRSVPLQRLQLLERRLAQHEKALGLPLPGEPPEASDLIEVSEAVELAGVTRQGIHYWIRQGRVRFVRVGARRTLVSRSDVLAARDETR